MNRVLPYLVAAVFGLACTPALAQSQAEGQQACGNDAFALCSDAIPDANRVAACLSKNFSRVSAPCRQYMASYGKSQKAAKHSSRKAKRNAARKHNKHYSERRHHRRHYRHSDG
jgi:hypothetical protein